MSQLVASALLLALILLLPQAGMSMTLTVACAVGGGYLVCVLQAWMLHTREARDDKEGRDG